MCMFYTWRWEWPDEQNPLGDAISPSPVKTVFSPLWANGTSGKWHVTLSGDWQGQAALFTSSFRLTRHVPDRGGKIALLWILEEKQSLSCQSQPVLNTHHRGKQTLAFVRLWDFGALFTQLSLAGERAGKQLSTESGSE